jgi:predicted Rossmann fold flavoprotein
MILMSNFDYDCIIIGGGASGLMCGSYLAKKISRLAIIDSNSRLGKKLSLTGNGRCNMSNSNIETSNYSSDDSSFVDSAFSQVDVNESLSFFESKLSVLTSSKDYLVYPYTYKAETVVEAFREYIKDNSIELLLGRSVVAINPIDGGARVTCSSKETYTSRYVVVATGGMSYPKTGSDGSGYKLVLPFVGTENLENPMPALVQLLSNDKNIKSLSGIRSQVKVSIRGSKSINDVIAVEKGEILFTDYGISGICIMQLSSLCLSYAKRNKNYPIVYIDFFDSYSLEDVVHMILRRQESFPNRSIVGALSGMINSKIVEVILKRHNLDGRVLISSLQRNKVETIAMELKSFSVNISGTMGFDFAQVTHGGIKLNSLSHLTMRLKSNKHIFLCGEILNVDGPCGGYNLQWAWTSGILAAKGVIKSIEGEETNEV